MSKRFTETEIWKDPWFRKLPCKYKMFWKYITEQCDEAGIWKPDFELASFYIGEEIDINEATKVFNEGKQRIIVLDNRGFLICDFISFQYGELKRDYNPHKKAITLLDKRNLSLNLQERLVQACGKLLNKDKDMVKDKKKVKDQDFGKSENLLVSEIDHKAEFDKLWSKYRRKKGDKKKLFEKFQQQIKTKQDLENITKALENYNYSKQNTALKYIAHGSTWFNEEWRDWIDYREEPEGQKKRASPGEPLQDKWSMVPVFGENEEVQA